MKKNTVCGRLLGLCVIFMCLICLTACSGGGGGVPRDDNGSSDISNADTTDTSASDSSGAENTDDDANDASSGSATVFDVNNIEDHDDPQDYVWDAGAEKSIVLNGNAINAASGVVVDDCVATIISAGTYRITGFLSDGQIIVDTDDDETVRLILDGVSITSTASAPLYVEKAEKTIIVLEDNSNNYIYDTTNYEFADAETDEPNAAVFSKDDLTISGNGALTVEGNYNDAIAGKDGLVIDSGTIMVNAVDDGIRGKDYIVIKGGSIIVDAGGDGMKSDKEGDSVKGYILVENGKVQVTAGGDAVQADTGVLVTGGVLNLASGGGSNGYVYGDDSAKGIKASAGIIINGGTFTIDSADDAVHCNGTMTINGGTFTIASGDDGMHADGDLVVNNGAIDISESYEGLESGDGDITINNGEIHIGSSDDGINVAGGGDGSGMMGGPGHPGQDFNPSSSSTSNEYCLYINGGYLAVYAQGDGLDSNGAVEMTGGTVLVHGPTGNDNGALDHNSFEITGGFLLAVGSADMAQGPDVETNQKSITGTFNTRSAGTLINLQTSAGTTLFTFKPAKAYASIAFSSPQLATGVEYEVYFGGSSTGTVKDGLYSNGTYTPGTLYTTFGLN